MFIHILRGLLGITVILGIVFLFSRKKREINWRLVGTGILLQLFIGVLVLQINAVRELFDSVSDVFRLLLGYTMDGAAFVFGPLTSVSDSGFIFAIQVLPTIIFFSALTSALYYLGILQIVVRAIAWVMSKLMRLSGPESLSAAGNIFLGQTEAPLLVKPYVANMTMSELMCLMTGGMATIAGGVLAAYIGILGPDFAPHLLTASIMNAPAAIVVSKILIPEDRQHQIDTKLKLSDEKIGVNFIDAISNGTIEGLKLALNVGAMLIAFIAIIYLMNGLLGWVGDLTNLNAQIAAGTEGQFKELSLQFIFGEIFRPLAWLIGIEWDDTLIAGSLLGEKTVINEFIAYSSLGSLEEGVMSARSEKIIAYALCGFSNFSSIAIQIGGIGGIAPNQRQNLSRLGLYAVLGGTMACLMTATIAGMFIP